jgi:arabinose-5-phosphate isomerase
MDEERSIIEAKEVLRIEAESILQLIDKVGESFSRAVELIYRSKGRVIVTGIGKSGLVGRKIVATLTSTGTLALFLHPVEGLHGDLGIVTKDDVFLAISHSGETAELNMIIDSICNIGVPRIAFTGNLFSTLARACEVVIDVGVAKEACPFGLTPTSSSFFKFHPGGNLGSRLRARVRDVMLGGAQIPRVGYDAPVLEAIREMDQKNKGFVLVADGDDTLLGILTDGDIRRLVRTGQEFRDERISAFMTRNPKTIRENISVAQAIEYMQRDEITTLVVTDAANHLKGYIHIHDLLGRGGTLKITVAE